MTAVIKVKNEMLERIDVLKAILLPVKYKSE